MPGKRNKRSKTDKINKPQTECDKNQTFIDKQTPLNSKGINKLNHKQPDTASILLSYENQLVQDEISNALAVVLHFHRHDDDMITTAMDLLGYCDAQCIQYYRHEETIINALDSVADPKYGVLIQKYARLLSHLPLTANSTIVKPLLDAGLLESVRQRLLFNYEDVETVQSIIDIIKQVIQADPKLAQVLPNKNTRGVIQAIKTHQDNAKVLREILNIIYAISVVDPKALKYLKKVGLDNELVKILKQENISDETATVIEEFVDNYNVKQDDIDELSKSIQQVEAKHESTVEEIDPNSTLNALTKLNGLLVNQNYAKNYIIQGGIGDLFHQADVNMG
eukprot:213462_1